MTYQTILFDLDGTLTRPEEGILKSVVYALEKQGIAAPSHAELLKFIGPPLLDSYQNFFGMTEKQAQETSAYYRERYGEIGWRENELYAGIPELLAKLKVAGKQLLVATSKPEPFARKILEYFNLADYFDVIAGSTIDGSRRHKADVIAYALSQSPSEKVVMVGDTHFDMAGAQANALPAIGVLYGYGSRQELEEAGAVAIAETVEELSELLSGK